MRSRILIGASAWVLGAVTATGGSLYAVDQLGHGLLDQNVAQVTIARVNAELATEHSEPPGARGAGPLGSASPASSGAIRPGLTTPSATAASGQLLTAADGTVVAVCKPGGAYLIYWSPQQGFEADHVQRGPAQVATVTFGSPGGGEVMKVTCTGSTPVAHVSPLGWSDNGSGPDN